MAWERMTGVPGFLCALSLPALNIDFKKNNSNSDMHIFLFFNRILKIPSFCWSFSQIGLLFGSCHFYFLPALCSGCCPLHTVHALGRADLLDGSRGELPGGLCFLRPGRLNTRGAVSLS